MILLCDTFPWCFFVGAKKGLDKYYFKSILSQFLCSAGVWFDSFVSMKTKLMKSYHATLFHTLTDVLNPQETYVVAKVTEINI